MDDFPTDHRSLLAPFPGEPTPRLHRGVVEVLRTRRYNHRTEASAFTRYVGREGSYADQPEQALAGSHPLKLGAEGRGTTRENAYE